MLFVAWCAAPRNKNTQKLYLLLESECTPCRVEPRGALAYLYGAKDGRAILAVRAAAEFERVRVFTPAEIETSLPAGLTWDERGALVCPAAEQPAFYVLTVKE